VGGRQDRGAIVNISSIAGVMASAARSPSCSKGALNTLTLTLARWFSRRCASIRCAGFIQTRWLLGGMAEEKLQQDEAEPGTDRAATSSRHPSRWRSVMFFLISASNITGEFLNRRRRHSPGEPAMKAR